MINRKSKHNSNMRKIHCNKILAQNYTTLNCSSKMKKTKPLLLYTLQQRFSNGSHMNWDIKKFIGNYICHFNPPSSTTKPLSLQGKQPCRNVCTFHGTCLWLLGCRYEPHNAGTSQYKLNVARPLDMRRGLITLSYGVQLPSRQLPCIQMWVIYKHKDTS